MMKIHYGIFVASFFFSSFIFAQSGTFDFETATSSGSPSVITQTVSSVTLTVSSSADEVAVDPYVAYGMTVVGISGKTAINPNDMTQTFVFSFSSPADITTLKVYEGTQSGSSGTLTLVPTGGSNSTVYFTPSPNNWNNSAKLVTLNWVDVTAITITTPYTYYWGFDDIVMEESASAPTTQASSVGFSSTSTTGTTVSWTRGDGDNCAVFMKAASSGTASPVDNTTYTANTSFGAGTQIGSTGWYCVYNGSGTSVSVSGLSLATTYRTHVCEYNGSAGSELYLISSGTDNPDNVTTSTPTITFTNGANATLDFQQTPASNPLPHSNWLCGQFSLAGDVTGATLNSVTVTINGTYDPGDLSSNPFQLYAASSNNFGSSSAIGSSMADPGSGSDVTFTGLSDDIPASTRYYWVTADISTNANYDDTMNGTIDAAGDLSITSGTLSGSSSYGKLNAGTDASLPVDLSSFSAVCEGQTIILEWVTESETENLGFILERKTDNSEWTTIASYQTNMDLQGQGNTSSKTEYSFVDTEVEPGTAYEYRLSDVSTDGKMTTYTSLPITLNALPEETEMEKAYPNPFNPSTYISYHLAEDSQVEISVFDMLGRKVQTLFTGQQLAGSYHVYWHGKSDKGNVAPTGMYLIRMQTENTAQVQKVLLMK